MERIALGDLFIDKERVMPHTAFDLKAAIAKDNSLPANCFRVNGDGSMQEGFEIELSHPLTGGNPAIFVGNRFIARNAKSGLGCFYKPFSAKGGLVRRLKIDKTERPNGPILLASRAQDKTDSLLLLVNPYVELPSNMTQRERFWSGVVYAGTVIAQSCGESLIEFTPADESALVFYTDGKVIRIIRKGDALTTAMLSMEEMAQTRIEQALRGLASTKEPGTIDFWYHQLVAVMHIGGNRSKTVFETAYRHLEDAARKRAFSKAVAQHAFAALKNRPEHLLRFGRLLEVRRPVAKQVPSTLKSTGSTPQAKKGPPAERLKKVRERAERDRAQCKSGKGSKK